MKNKGFKKNNGFTLIETLVGLAIFFIVASAVYSSFASLIRLANNNQARSIAVQLAAEQFEIIRNMPYTNIGLTNGIPNGVLPQNQSLNRGGIIFNVLLTVRNINLSTSTVQASDKLVEVEVTCPGCKNFETVTLTGQISPANLQSAGSGGALVTQVFNGNGEPVEDATVSVQSVATSSIQNTDVTNNFGILNIIGVPPGANMYKIIVTKDGYSRDETFPIGAVGNPNPTQPNVTVLNQQVSQTSFSIDRLSKLNFSSVSPLCVPVSGMDFSLVGAKNIGVGVPKYSQNLATNGSGVLSLNSMEWDTYTITPTDNAYEIAGINPDSPFSLNPDSIKNIQLVVVPKNPQSLMVSVINSLSGLPVSGASVELTNAGYSNEKTTGQGYLSQTDWSSGSGQDVFVNESKYFNDNGSVDTATSSGDIVLMQFFNLYDKNATGTLESSTFDTGTTSNYYSLSWFPNNQPLDSGSNSLKIQFATNSSSTDSNWNYFGPDGTGNTYYTVPGGSINSVGNDKQYARYKAFLTTDSTTSTPKLSSIYFTYSSGCISPGQVLFQGLSTGTYTVKVTKSGYDVYTGSVTVGNGWQRFNVPLISQ